VVKKANHPARGRISFGVFEADLQAGELYRSGFRVRLQSQPFKLLAVLLQHAGEVVSRETLQKELWGTDTTVDFDHSLGIAVNKLREALGDSADNPRFVETLAKRGYRFMAPVKIPEVVVSEVSASADGADPAPRVPASWWLAGTLGLFSIGAMTALVTRPPARLPYEINQATYSGHVLTSDETVESFSSSVSDGTRIYFSHIENGNPVLAVALAANGEISRFHLPSEIGEPLICGLSTDGSKLLVRSHLKAEPEQTLWIVPTLGGNARRVPNVLAHDAAWMPDGKRLVVASGNELTVMNTDGSNQHRLLTTQGLAFWLRWSPDGQRLRFTLRDPVRQTSALWEVDADGGHAHALLEGWNQPAQECCGNWTGDGRYFVFQSAHNGRHEIWAWQERPWWRGGNSRPWPVTGGPLDYQAPGTMPGNSRIYFIGATLEFQLLQAVPHSSQFTAMDKILSAASLAQFSPDGKWVAWLNAADNTLWRSRIDGSDRIALTAPPLRIFNLQWSPDNRRLALMGEEPGKPWKIYLIDAEGGQPVPVLNENRNEADPSWSPDGRSIIFGRPPDRMDNVQPKAIYQLDMETHQATEIPGSVGLFSPRLSPDGRYLVAMPLNQGSLQLYDRVTGHWTTLTDQAAGDPTFSHDGHDLYFQNFLEAGRPIYRVAIPSGKPEQVATIDNLLPITATEYRLIGLAPGDLPVVTARTPEVNIYQTDLGR
jgi:Tol biopolymer transport system component/DNA-binding winged helix-turn-helix (wHTH) protein